MNECRVFGWKLRNVRRLRRWSQEKVAQRAGVSRSYLADVERGRGNPTLSIIYKLAAALGVAPGRLLVSSTTSTQGGGHGRQAAQDDSRRDNAAVPEG